MMCSTGRVTGLAVTPSGDACVTCSTDKSARLFKVPFAPLEAGPVERDVSAVLEFHGKYGFRSLDHHWRDNKFVTGGEKVKAASFFLKSLAKNCSTSFCISIILTGVRFSLELDAAFLPSKLPELCRRA